MLHLQHSYLRKMNNQDYSQFEDLLTLNSAELKDFIPNEFPDISGSDSELINEMTSRSQRKPVSSGLKTSIQPSSAVSNDPPKVIIVEQPRARGLRFRYECEGRSAGSIPGATSSPEKKTFPTIKIWNYKGPAVIVVSCVTKIDPAKPHPHSLVGKDCKKGVCTLKVKNTDVITFPNLGIQCAKRKEVISSLNLRKAINVDPFQTGFDHKDSAIDLNVVRLCFQVFLQDEKGSISKILPPVVSQPIIDKKAMNELTICRVDRTSGRAQGSSEIFLLCDKVNKDDITVRFFEKDKDGSITWEKYGDFGQGDVHRQVAIVFKSPAFKNTLITQPAHVFMQLKRPSDGEESEPIQFTYMPEDPDPDRIEEKRKRKTLAHPVENVNLNVKDRLRLKATRGRLANRHENTVLPMYSFENTSVKTEMCQPLETADPSTSTSNSQNSNQLIIDPQNLPTIGINTPEQFNEMFYGQDMFQTQSSGNLVLTGDVSLPQMNSGQTELLDQVTLQKYSQEFDSFSELDLSGDLFNLLSSTIDNQQQQYEIQQAVQNLHE